MYYALVSRNETYLMLNGAKGAGKGLFCAMAAALVGQDNYSEAPDTLLESGFNSVLDKKRIILMDELVIDKQKHTRLKRYGNSKLNIEKKGVDADKAVETYNSYIINNNDESDVYLEHDDRRFSVPTITHKRLRDIMSDEEISELHSEFENPDSDMIWKFGYWLFHRQAKKYSKFDALKGEKFYRLVEASLHQWQKFLVGAVQNADTEYLSLSNIRRASSVNNKMSKFPQDVKKVNDFLTNYLVNGEHSLGELVQYEGETCIKVNKIFVKETEEDSEGDMI